MSPVSKRTGKRYAAGSHMVRGDYPKNCEACGEFVPLNDCFQVSIGTAKSSWHHGCWLQQRVHVCVIDESAGLAGPP